MGEAIDLRDLTDAEVAFVKGIVERMRQRHETTEAQETGPKGESEWGALSAAAFAEDWDNEQDAIYDNWRERYSLAEK